MRIILIIIVRQCRFLYAVCRKSYIRSKVQRHVSVFRTSLSTHVNACMPAWTQNNWGCNNSWMTWEMSTRAGVTWQPTSSSDCYEEVIHWLPDANQSLRDLSAVCLVQVYSSSQPSTFIKNDLSDLRKRMFSRQMLKCKVSGMKGENRWIIPQLFQGGWKRRKELEQKHQRAIEKGVKMEKCHEIFRRRSQQVVKSAASIYITMNIILTLTKCKYEKKNIQLPI